MRKLFTSRTHPRQSGLTMVELLVALAIGGFLIIGAVTLQSQTRRTFDVNEQQARLQENARFVLAMLEPNLQLAGVFGFSQDPTAVVWSNNGALTPPSQLRMASPIAPGLPAGLAICGDNFAVDVLAPATAINGEFDLDCDPEGGGHVADSDVLIVRHTAPVSVAADASKLQVYSERLSAQMGTRMFVSGTAPNAPVAGLREVRDMVVRAYYLAQDADGHPGVPALRAKLLSSVGGAPTFVDQELIRGIEDLQVQFGIDPGDDIDGDGIPDDPSGDGMSDFVNGYAAQYVNAGDSLIDSGQVVAVRVWVRVRSDEPERGFVDDRRYQYADTDFTPNDNFRRVLMSRTIYLRNSRQQ